jgi:serine/threonine protein kinase
MERIKLLIILFFIPYLTQSICESEVRKFHDYTCVQTDPIGMGSRGTIYLVNKDGLNYILKVQETSSSSKKELENLQLMKDASYVVQLIEHLSTWDKLFMILSYGSKGNMAEFIDNEDYFNDIDNVFSFFRKLVEGLETIHERGLVHADMKLENVVVDDENNPVIIDFDNSQPINTKGDPRGTIDYMSPEMVREFELRGSPEFHTEMDYYAIGVMLYGVVKKRLPTNCRFIEYYELMTAKIAFKAQDLKYFFDLAFGLIQPLSNRINYDKVSYILEQTALNPNEDEVGKKVVYTLSDYANEDEKPKSPNKFLLYVLLLVAIAFVIGIGFFLKKCVVNEEEVKKAGLIEDDKNVVNSAMTDDRREI